MFEDLFLGVICSFLLNFVLVLIYQVFFADLFFHRWSKMIRLMVERQKFSVLFLSVFLVISIFLSRTAEISWLRILGISFVGLIWGMIGSFHTLLKYGLRVSAFRVCLISYFLGIVLSLFFTVFFSLLF